KTLAQNVQNPLGILEIRKCHHGIVGESGKGTFPLQAWLHLVLEPFIQHVGRKTFDRQGEITPPCGEPSVAWRRSPSSSTPAFSHLSIILRMTPSVTRLSRNERRWECDIDPK